jgi:hypothetical protein
MSVHTFFRNHLCSELVTVARVDDERSEAALDANLEEIGEWSALILAQDPIDPGTNLRVKGQAHELTGVVRACTFDRVLGFFIEIALDAESRWSEKWFVPEHLYALCPSMRCFTQTFSKVPEEILLAKPAHF